MDKPNNASTISNPLGEKQELQADVVSREIDLNEGIIIQVSEETLHKSKSKKKKKIFKAIHEMHKSSDTFIDMDNIKNLIMSESSIEFSMDANYDIPDTEYSEPTLDLDDFINLLDLDGSEEDQEDQED